MTADVAGFTLWLLAMPFSWPSAQAVKFSPVALRMWATLDARAFVPTAPHAEVAEVIGDFEMVVLPFAPHCARAFLPMPDLNLVQALRSDE